MKIIAVFVVMIAGAVGVYFWQHQATVSERVDTVSTMTAAEKVVEAEEGLDCSKLITPAELNAVFGQSGDAQITTRGDMCDWEIKNPSGQDYREVGSINGSISITEIKPEDIESTKRLRVKICTPVNTLRKTPAPVMLDIGDYSCLTDDYTPIVHVYWENKILVITLGDHANDESLKGMYKKGMIDFARLVFSRVR